MDPATIDDYGLPAHPPCPFCDGRDTELVSPFGSVLSVAAFWCRSCHSAFELVKWEETTPPPGHPDGETEGRGDGESSDAPGR